MLALRGAHFPQGLEQPLNRAQSQGPGLFAFPKTYFHKELYTPVVPVVGTGHTVSSPLWSHVPSSPQCIMLCAVLMSLHLTEQYLFLNL